MNVSFGLSGYPILFTPLQQNIAILGTVDNIFTESFNEYPRKLVLSYDQRFVLLTVLEQVVELFIIDLKERTIDSET